MLIKKFLRLKLLHILLFNLLATGCNRFIVNKPYFGYQGNYPSTAVDRFRWEVCIRILDKAYKGTSAFTEISKKDLIIHPTDIVYSKAYYRAIDSIADTFLYNAPKAHWLRSLASSDSTGAKMLQNMKDRDKEENYKKDLFLFAVFNFYESRELDSLARHYMEISDKEYKKAVNDSYKPYIKRLKKKQ